MAELSDEKEKPLLHFPADDEDSKRSPEQIVLVFLDPDKNKLSFSDKNVFKKLKSKHPNTEIIYVDRNDFTDKGELKSEYAGKYKAFSCPTVKKVIVSGHGSAKERNCDRIYSNHDAYPASGCWGTFFGKRVSKDFSAALVAKLIKRIPNPAIYKSSQELACMQRLPDNGDYLKISLDSCYGELFSNHLCKELSKKNNQDKFLLCSITAGHKNSLLMIHGNGDKSYQHALLFAFVNYGRKMSAIGLMASGGVMTKGIITKDMDLADNAFISFLVFTSILAVLNTCSFMSETSAGNSNRGDKVVFIPDFRALQKFSNQDSMPIEKLTKDEFIRRYQPERIREEQEERELYAKPIEVQYGTIL